MQETEASRRALNKLKLEMNFADLPNLASAQLGATILFATDEWFASAGIFSSLFQFEAIYVS